MTGTSLCSQLQWQQMGVSPLEWIILGSSLRIAGHTQMPTSSYHIIAVMCRWNWIGSRISCMLQMWKDYPFIKLIRPDCSCITLTNHWSVRMIPLYSLLSVRIHTPIRHSHVSRKWLYSLSVGRIWRFGPLDCNPRRLILLISLASFSCTWIHTSLGPISPSQWWTRTHCSSHNPGSTRSTSPKSYSISPHAQATSPTSTPT